MPEPTAASPADDPGSEPLVDAIELQTAVLVRNLEMLRRRGDFYVEVDRAGYLLLRTLDAIGPADVGTLAATLGLDPSTAGRQVGVAHAAGHVERRPSDEDRRRQVVELSDAGRAAMAAVLRRRLTGTVAMLADWTHDDLETLATMLTRYNTAITDQYIDLDPARARSAAG